MIIKIMLLLYFPHCNWPTCWIIKRVKFYMLTRLEEWETSLCQIVSKLVYPKQRYCDFSIFQMAAAAMFYFYNRQLFWQTVSRGSRLTSKSNFCKIDQSVAKILRFFQFFKMAGNAILDVQICEISLADSVWKAQTYYRAKCSQNWSSCCGDIAFFQIFKMADVAILDFWNS